MATPPSVNTEFVERYQLELEKNPRSRVFAALAEAYRKMGLLEEARRICRFGTEANPDFAGGFVANAKVLLDLKAPADALPSLEKATKLSPDNLLAHNLLGETLIQLRRPKEALKAFKMVLFLDPENSRAKEAVKKWEFLTADEYPDEVFQMTPVLDVSKKAMRNQSAAPASEDLDSLDDQLEDLLTESGGPKTSRLDLQQRHARALERAVSLADAFTVRNDLEAAAKVLEDASRLLGPNSEIERRLKLISKRMEALADEAPTEDEVPPPEMSLPFDPPILQSARKREILETLLRRINDRRGPAAG